jgi:hypothetical protein
MPEAVPVEILAERFAMEVHIHAILLAKAHEDVAGHPDFISGTFRAFAEDLEFPLALGDLGIDAFVIDAGVEADVEMLLDDLAGDVSHRAVAHAGVIKPLRSRKTLGWKTERTAVLVKEILLLEAEPSLGIVQDGGAGVGDVGSAVRHHDFAHDEDAVLASGIREGLRRVSKRSRSCRRVPDGWSCRQIPTKEVLQALGSWRIP